MTFLNDPLWQTFVVTDEEDDAWRERLAVADRLDDFTPAGDLSSPQTGIADRDASPSRGVRRPTPSVGAPDPCPYCVRGFVTGPNGESWRCSFCHPKRKTAA
jgi:hypothetical protein